MAGGVSIALAKPNKGVRPLCSGDSLRRLVAKCFCAKGFDGKNYGVGCSQGVEKVSHSLRDALTRHKDSDMALLKIDFANAFNRMERDTFVLAASKKFPGLERWTRWCYTRPPLLIYDHQHISHLGAECNKATRLGHCTSVADYKIWSIRSPN
jgi:hypothetical protein